MRRARTYPWIRIRPYRVLLRGQGVFFAVRSLADCITNMSGFDLRQAQVAWQLALELGKVTGDHSDVETPQDRLLGLAIKQELKRSLDAMLRRMHSHRQSFASVSCHRDVMASLARSHTDHDLEFEWFAFAGSLPLDPTLPPPSLV